MREAFAIAGIQLKDCAAKKEIVTILEIKDLHKSYNASTPVLRGVSVKIEQGEFVGIIGLSGSGKSTLLRCINRLIDASSGEIRIPRSLIGGTANGATADVLKLNGKELTISAAQGRHGVSAVQYRQAIVGYRKRVIRRAWLPAGIAQRAENFFP